MMTQLCSPVYTGIGSEMVDAMCVMNAGTK